MPRQERFLQDWTRLAKFTNDVRGTGYDWGLGIGYWVLGIGDWEEKRSLINKFFPSP